MLTGENLLAALCLIVLIAVIYWGYCITHKDEPEEIDFFDSRDLQEEVHALNEKMNRLAELDNMLIELKLCRPAEQMRSFRVEWQSVSGTDHVVDFMADGESESSESFKLWAVNERIRLNQDIAQRIYDLYAKAAYINQSPTSETLSGEWLESQELHDGERKYQKNSAGEW